MHRGLLFCGYGPIILGIVYVVLQYTVPDFSLTGSEVCLGVVSVYLLAFIQAGASVFNQIEEWPIAKSLLCHFSLLFVAYSLCYVLNTWIPFEPAVLLIFAAVFVAVYFTVWITVYLCVRAASRRLNTHLR